MAQMKTFVILVPNKLDTTVLSDYRSISLCTTLYKVYAKLMVERMKPILSHLICAKQGAFIGDRSIIDNMMIIQELMYDLR